MFARGIHRTENSGTEDGYQQNEYHESGYEDLK
jgi:hypothetical protein